jgi:FdhE protein
MENKNDIIVRLEREGEKRGLTPRFLEFYRRLFEIQFRAEKRIGITKPVIKLESMNERLEQGLPLISFNELALDWPLIKDIFIEVVSVFADYSDIFGELPENLQKSKSQLSLPKKTAKAWFESRELPTGMTINNADEHMLIDAIIQATLKPFLVSHSKVLSRYINQERWRRNYCPVCGGYPDFAFIDNEQASRWLLCSRCDTQWLFQRLQCPYCNNEEQKELAYFTDDLGIYRLYTCEKCHKYIKAIDLRATTSDILLPLERLFTLDMDRQAQEKGYQPDLPELSNSSAD